MPAPGPELSSQDVLRTTRQGRGRLWLLAKVAVTVALVTWLVRSGGLNFGTLRVLWTSPSVAFCSFINFTCGVIICGALRWRILIRVLGIQVSVGRALGLHWLGVFFNAFVPGNVGGDLIKNHAILDRDPGRLVVIALLERILGMTALLWTAIPAVVTSGSSLAAHPGGSDLVLLVLVFFALSLVGLAGASWVLPRLKPENGTSAADRGWSSKAGRLIQDQLRSGADTLRVFLASPVAVGKVLALSLLMHGIAVFNFWVIARHLNNPHATIAEMALIYPLGILSIALPISISGLGVGHLFFNELFKILGLIGGADVFNVGMVASLTLAGTGALPYWFMKLRKGAPLAQTK